MSVSPVSRRVWLVALAAAVACAESGCTTVLSTASLRDLVLGIDNHAEDSSIPESTDSTDVTRSEEDEAADAERRAAAIEEAVSRLSKIGDLDDAARDSLVATLQRTDQEDWPVVVEAFAESLAASPAPHVVAKADLDAASGDEETPAARVSEDKAPEEDTKEPSLLPSSAEAEKPSAEPIHLAEAAVIATVAPAPPAPAPAAPERDVTPAPAPPPSPALAIRNASFASRVQAWGVLDRFKTDRFRPGQEVIVYFELENLSAGESAAGHTTCIDSRIRLVTASGATVHEWTFEPIAETCRARRHDYFARYVIRIPSEAAPGPHRVELAVTDTLSGQVAVDAVEFDVLAASPSAE